MSGARLSTILITVCAVFSSAILAMAYWEVRRSRSGAIEKLDKMVKSQEEILATLKRQEQQLAQAQRAAPPPRPTIDPNKVYTIPVGNSAVRGPRNAPVTIVEFSDFQ